MLERVLMVLALAAGLCGAADALADTPVALAVSMHPAPGGARTGDIQGDVLIGGKPQANRGLHLVDANFTIGNLVDVVREESPPYLAKSAR